MAANYEKQGVVAIIRLDNPPVNGLDHASRAGLAEALQRAGSDGGVEAVVICGQGRMFSAGADISEFEQAAMAREPRLDALNVLIEQFPKPVIAALHGSVMGGGLELALACHYRVAARGTGMAFPEVKLGLLPGAGGTQRLPRVLGVEPALNLILSGDPAKSQLLAALPGQKLLDAVCEPDELLEQALAFAKKVAGQPSEDLPRVRALPCSHPQPDAYFEFARNSARQVAPNMPAPLKCIDAVEAATCKPFDEGLAFERRCFLELMTTPQSAALRHAFFAQRAASSVAGISQDTPRRSIQKVAVIGAGTMGGGIATVFLRAGLPVTVLEVKQEALDRGLQGIRDYFSGQVKKGRMDEAAAKTTLDRLAGSLSYADLADADLVVEAVFEDMNVKQKVFRQLDEVAKAGAILASNTSTLDLNRIAAVTGRPQDVLGMHFFSPAPVMPLLEVVRGDRTTPEVLATVMDLAKRLGKTAVVAGVCDGFIGNRMIEQYSRQAGFLLEEGATVSQIDQALEDFGFAMGPFRMADMAGNDIAWAIAKRHLAENPSLKYSRMAQRLCQAGRLGQKTGAGWYDYPSGPRKPQPSAKVAELVAAERRAWGIRPRKIDSREIIERTVYALINEGARVLQEGIASKASDIDVVYLMGYGFPPWRGGPMHYADQVGLFQVVQAMRRFGSRPGADREFWKPAPLLLEALAQGKSLDSMDRPSGEY